MKAMIGIVKLLSVNIVLITILQLKHHFISIVYEAYGISLSENIVKILVLVASLSYTILKIVNELQTYKVNALAIKERKSTIKEEEKDIEKSITRIGE